MASSSNAGAVLVIVLAWGLPLMFLVVGGIVGAITERRHFESIREREAATAHLPAVTARWVEEGRQIVEVRIAGGSVVVSLDYFKRFLAGLRNLVGGRVNSYESLLDRARREAILRLKEECAGADIILNLRLYTASIANTRGKQGAGGVEVFACGTMIRYAPEPGEVAPENAPAV